MNSITLSELAAWSGGAQIAGKPSDVVSRISTDTRTIMPGDSFLALNGDNFNGHDFVSKAIENGATTLILSQLPEETETYRGNIVHVRNTLQSLQNIALNYRRNRIPDIFAVGVTGSNGKTSTKDFLCGVLGMGGNVNATKGNLNNHIGLPVTVLETSSEHTYGVWEMGMNHPGEISPLAEIAAPNAAVITNIGTAHIEHMKTREAIADEKAALPRSIGSTGFCVMPAGDDFFQHIRKQLRCEMVGIGQSNSSVRAEKIAIHEDGVSFELLIENQSASVCLPVPGRHMVTNALLAAAVGYRVGLPVDSIASGLTNAALTGGRLERDKWNGVLILNDSYNANPDSVFAAINSLMETPGKGRKIAALGFMGELGEHESSAHRKVGEFAGEAGVDLLVTVTEKAGQIQCGVGEKIPTAHFDNHAEAAAFLVSNLQTGDILLVKGSRAATMEKVIENLKNSAN